MTSAPATFQAARFWLNVDAFENTDPLKRYLARDITQISATAGEGSHCSLDETKYWL